MTDKHPELAFLPAALEIQDRPPSPIGNIIIWTIVALFTATVVWAFFGKLDIVAVAHGKVIPQGRSKIVQPLETSIVRGIHVDNGQHVTQGELLVQLDSTDAGASIEQLQHEIVSTRDQIVRANTLLEAIESRELDLGQLTDRVDPASLLLQQQILQAAYDEFSATLAENAHGIDRAKSAHTAAREQVLKLEATLPILTERLQALELLVSKNLVARTQYLELKQQHIEAEQDLKTQQATMASAASQISELKEHQHVVESIRRTEILQEVKDLDVRRQYLQNDLLKAQQTNASKQLLAPIDGVVQQLNVFTVGGVVTPAEQLMVIVPDDEDLVVEAMVLNRDIGFVRERQMVTVKLDAFPYTRYGFIEGEIVTLSDDAVPVEDLGLAYTANVRLEKTSIDVEGRAVGLSPGMSVTVEIMTGKRRVIEFLMSPLLRYGSESARER